MSSKVYLATKNDLGALQTTGVSVGEVGVVTWQYTLLANHLKLDGTTVLGAEYPLLLAFAVNRALITTDAENKVLFKYDETTDVLTLPDLTGLCVQGGADAAQIAPGLPNITGTFELRHVTVNADLLYTATGAVEKTSRSGTNLGEIQYTNSNTTSSAQVVEFDASKHNAIYSNDIATVQPPAVTLIPQIRYAADVTRGNDYTIGATGLWEDMVGHVLYDVVLRDGFIKANGASVALASTSVPRLVAFVHEHPELTGDGPEFYNYVEADDTLTLPNYIGLVPQGGESMCKVAAGLPNITGRIIAWALGAYNAADYQTGSLYVNGIRNNYTVNPVGASGWICLDGININASRSSSIYGASTTVQPPAITLIPQIKY